ncbi:bactofilin family protein [Yunchengibacter salinarum]|uniref:bactofilin family protein n=1 Tax=Yunchengibacter salinarum TaxID=3133399 RepID=UPI0035B582BE
MTKIPTKEAPTPPTGGVGSPTPAIIGSDVQIDGNVRTAGELQLDGSIKGDIDCGGLVMGETASIEGMITAESVTVRGKVNGEIRAGSVSLEKSAVVDGDIYHETLTVQAGARLTGKLAQGNDVGRGHGAAPSAPPPPPSAPTPPPESGNGGDDTQPGGQG